MNANHGDLCPYLLPGLLDNPLRRMLHNPVTILSGLVSPGQTALDLGCGPGIFTLGLARLVGTGGQVVAVDLQQPMLEKALARLKWAGLQGRVRFEKCRPDRIGLQDFAGRADFALAFWMVHEVSNPARFLAEVCTYLKPGGQFLIAEPRLHVSARHFLNTAGILHELGLTSIGQPKIAISRAALFQIP